MAVLVVLGLGSFGPTEIHILNYLLALLIRLPGFKVYSWMQVSPSTIVWLFEETFGLLPTLVLVVKFSSCFIDFCFCAFLFDTQHLIDIHNGVSSINFLFQEFRTFNYSLLQFIIHVWVLALSRMGIHFARRVEGGFKYKTVSQVSQKTDFGALFNRRCTLTLPILVGKTIMFPTCFCKMLQSHLIESLTWLLNGPVLIVAGHTLGLKSLVDKYAIVAVYPRRLRAYNCKKRKDIPDHLKIRENCIKTIYYSISIFIIKIHSYINAFTCSWYISKTYHSPENVHVTATYCIHSTPVYWSRLGRNGYGTDTYLLSSYFKSEYLFRTRSVATSLVTSHQNHSNSEWYHAVLRRANTEQFRSHSFHSFQQHSNEQCYNRVRNRSGTA